MCLDVNNELTEKKLKGVNPNHVFTFYKELYYNCDNGFLTTPYEQVRITSRIVTVKNPIKRSSRLKEINGHALHLCKDKSKHALFANVHIPVKVLAKHVIKFGDTYDVCVSQYEIPKKYAKKYNLK